MLPRRPWLLLLLAGHMQKPLSRFALLPLSMSLSLISPQVTPSAQSTGGAWTTVGANGKMPGAAAPRPAITPSNSTATIASATAPRPNGTVARPPATTVAKIVAPRVEDFPITPSHDFLKWLSESLKGLNNSVNCGCISWFARVLVADVFCL